jgi:inward rectifier potassium channel
MINRALPGYRVCERLEMFDGHSERTARARVVRLAGREIIAEGLSLNFWADISHRCMTASWPALIVGAALVFLVFNAIFAFIYWIGFHGIGDQPISNVPGGAYIDYFYFSIETLSTAGYGDMHPQSHYGHFIATIELFTGIFSMSLMTGLIFARFSRPSARLLFANNPEHADPDDSLRQRAAQCDRQRDRAAVDVQERGDFRRPPVPALLRAAAIT